MGEGRRPLAGLVTLPPGGPGSPSGPTTRACLQWLDAARTKGGESCPDRGPGSGPVRARKHGPGDRKAARGAPQGDALCRPERASPRPDKGGGGRTEVVAPCGAPRPRTSPYEKRGVDSPALKGRGLRRKGTPPARPSARGDDAACPPKISPKEQHHEDEHAHEDEPEWEGASRRTAGRHRRAAL